MVWKLTAVQRFAVTLLSAAQKKCGLAVAMSWLDGQRAIGAGKCA